MKQYKILAHILDLALQCKRKFTCIKQLTIGLSQACSMLVTNLQQAAKPVTSL